MVEKHIMMPEACSAHYAQHSTAYGMANAHTSHQKLLDAPTAHTPTAHTPTAHTTTAHVHLELLLPAAPHASHATATKKGVEHFKGIS